MTLTPEQQAEIAEARAHSRPTLRATADGMEKHLYVAHPILDHGLVRVIDYMGDDAAITQAARVSYGRGTKAVQNDEGLIRYLMRHWHSTPFVMCEVKFHVKLPVFVARQWIRHRTANVNEYSARYSVVQDRFYHPVAQDIRQQSAANRQGGDQPMDSLTAREFCNWLDEIEKTYEKYEYFIEKGVARELARIALPASVYTEWYWKIDLHNLLHFLSLRMDPHAQQEIRDYASAMFELIRPIVPVAAEAFVDYNLQSMHLTRLEIEALRTGTPLATENKRENAEWDQKKARLGMSNPE